MIPTPRVVVNDHFDPAMVDEEQGRSIARPEALVTELLGHEVDEVDQVIHHATYL